MATPSHISDEGPEGPYARNETISPDHDAKATLVAFPSEDETEMQPKPRWMMQSHCGLNSWQFSLLNMFISFALFVVILGELIRENAPSSPPKITHLASLGSSFASGPGISPTVNSSAGRSGKNYGALLAKHIDVELTDLAVSGATLLNLITVPQYTPDHTFAPQVDDLPSDVDLVLVLGGGNDLDYVGGLMRDNGVANGWTFENSKYKRSALRSAEALAKRYATVLDAIHDAVPDAVVLIVEYLTLLGRDFWPGVDAPFDSDRADYHRNKANMLHNGTVLAVTGREDWCHIVEVGRMSWRHGIGSKEPWVADHRGISTRAGVPYHPNAAGMQAVERMTFRKLVELGLVDYDGEL